MTSRARKFAESLVVAVALVAGASACAGDSESSPVPNPMTSAPIEAGGLVLVGSPTVGSTLVLNGKLTNASGQAITVVGGSAYFASQLQVIKNVLIKGKPAVQLGVPLEIAADGSVPLTPKGFQIRVIKLTRNLKRGTTVPLNITLATGQTMTANAKVA